MLTDFYRYLQRKSKKTFKQERMPENSKGKGQATPNEHGRT